MNHADHTKNAMDNVIESHVERRAEFVRNPDVDFTRNRKLDMESMIRMTLSMQGGSLAMEIEKYFKFSEGTPTKSAFVQQLLPSVFESIFHEFSKQCNLSQVYKGYHIFAVDGSDLNVTLDPEAPSYIRVNSDSYCNQLHLNAFYDK